MIVETTLYYAKPGGAEAVLQLRRRGSALRLSLGLPPGEILVTQDGSGPNVKWECRFSDRAAFEADLAARDANPAFGEQRRQMATLLERFERHVFAPVAIEEPAI